MKPNYLRTTHLLAAFSLSSLAASLSAQILWDGATSTDFSDATNWVGGVAPTGADVAAFNAAASNQPALSANSAVLGVDFQTGGWTLGGATTLTVGASGVTSTGNNAITARVSAAASSFSSAAGGQLDLNTIVGNTVTFGTAANTGTVVLGGTVDNNSFTPVVGFGTLVLNKSGTTASSTSGLTVDAGATVQFGSNLTSRNVAGGRGQVYGTTTLNGTMDLNGQGLTVADTFNWSMGGLTGAGTVTNNGAGSAELRIRGGGNFSGDITDGTSTTAMYIQTNYQLNGAAKTYTGGTTIDGGEVILNMGSGANGLGTGVITLTNGGHFKNRNNNPVINNDIVVGTGGGGIEAGWGNGLGGGRGFTVNGQISGSELLTIVNDGGWTRLENGANSHSGGTLVRGYVQANSGAFGTGDITLNGDGTNRGGIQNRNGYDVHANNVIVDAGGGIMKAGWNANLEFTGVVSGSGRLRIQEDSGTVVLSNGANSFEGDITFDGANSRISVASLEGGSYDGVISGAGTFDYDGGSGTQTLLSTSTYTGSTTITSGTLLVDGDISSSPDTFVRPNGTIGGNLGLVSNLHFEAGAKLDVTTGNLTMKDGSTLSFDDFGFDDLVGSTYMTDPNGIYLLIDDETATGLTLDTANLANFGEANALLRPDGKEVFFIEGSFAYQVVPEPSTALLSGLSALALLRRRRA